jgi:hypothetical protein
LLGQETGDTAGDTVSITIYTDTACTLPEH